MPHSHRRKPPPPCDICGPQRAPNVHVICHPTPVSRGGCGHRLDRHTPTMHCQECGADCGVYVEARDFLL